MLIIGECYTWLNCSEPNVWVLDSIYNNECKFKLINGSPCGFIMSQDGLYPFSVIQINDPTNRWVNSTPIKPIKYIKEHTL